MKLKKIPYPRLIKNRRIKKKFAFLPIGLSNRDKIWLEYYWTYEVYSPFGLAWAGNNWKPGYKWQEEYVCSTKQELKLFLLEQYRKNKKEKKEWKRNLKLLFPNLGNE